jgi:hypothetical protein
MNMFNVTHFMWLDTSILNYEKYKNQIKTKISIN